ncbi:thrombospondin type-1 domain-containing protein 4-like isoform X2 [Mytilus californianus]|uniref:thrombospondin type-1 domain-containing protein 4-like isoform X2 n=1 Tax=Mytilus californianus TaxID=6549 RepID=UPI0022481B83|nr:thrombospondin type-1 domain-containing protein 4-like isoform X2 [Mytilus californianus]
MWIRLSTSWFTLLLMTSCVLTEQKTSQRSVFMEWTPWTICSKTCNQGIQMRTRDCVNTSKDCNQTEKQLKVCQQQECKGKVRDSRDLQCQHFSNKVVHRRRHHWYGYTHERNQCELYCKASYYGFYMKFGDKVEDGTTCKDSDADGICVNGRCQIIGCDGIAGSNARLDHCGVCSGDSSSCQLISGIFTRRYLKYGYNLISRIPSGACNINITEMSRSRNYLALKLTDGDYIINGNYRLTRNNVFREAGTTFTYHRNKRSEGCRSQCIMADGPTTKSIDLELLFYQVNTGIMYQFTVPNNLTDYFMQNMVPNLRENRRNPSAQLSNRNAHLSKQKDVHMITNPNELHKHRTQVNNNQNSRNVNSQAAVQSKPSFENTYSTNDNIRNTNSDTGNTRVSSTKTEQQQVDQSGYSYSGGLGAYNQAATGDYGQQSSGNNNVPLGQESFYGKKGYPVYSNGIPLGGSADGVPLGGSANSVSQGGIPLGGSANGVPLGETVNKPRLVIANHIPDSKNYFWRISGFTECSRTCGGGAQETKIICLKKDTNVMVTNENCDPRLKPQSQVLKCNSKICPPNWEFGNWSDCSASCGQGMQTRPVLCKQLIDSELHLDVPTSRCDSRTRPESARSCNTRLCAEWTNGEWGKCTVNCGRGQQEREVYCKHVDGQNTTESTCIGSKPQTVKSCNMGVCAVGWFYSKWSRRCSSSCGTGYVTRKVFCSAADGAPLPESKCSKSKPREKRPCRNRIPCGGIWFTGPWSKCSATCGDGRKKRDVICMKKLGEKLITVVGDENCLSKQKPTTTKPCKDLPPCQAEWFMTSWSKCSKSCDAGTKSRLVKCLDEDLSPSSTCSEDHRPTTRHVCNTDSCDLPQLDEDPTCIDKLQNCKLVPQAKIELCDYPFYKTACCRSCKKREHKTHYNRTHS